MSTEQQSRAEQQSRTEPGTAVSLENRIAALPRVDALGVEARTGAGAWFSGWTPRHTVVTLIAMPVFYAFYASAVGAFLPGNGLVLGSLILGSILGALVAATYLPTGRKAAGPTPCAAGAIFPLVLAMFLFEGALATPVSAVLATVLVGAGLAQRVFGAGACSA